MNIVQVLFQTFAKDPDQPAIVFENRTYRFREIEEEVRRRVLWLKKIGVQQGERIAIRLPKGMEFVFWHLAVLATGAISLPLNPAYSSEEMTYYLSDSESSLFITENEGFHRLHLAIDKLAGLKTLFVDGISPAGWGPLPRELENVGPGDLSPSPTEGEDTALIIYTSGTTGKPKGAMLTHRNLAANMLALKKLWAWTERDVLLHVLPLFHIHGLLVALHGGLYAGSTQIIHEKFDAPRVWQTIEKMKCTLLMGVPTIYRRLWKDWDHHKADLRSMRLFISGSAPLGESLFHHFEEATGFRILERYGMTETGIIASNPLDVKKTKSVGYPLPGVQIRLVAETEGSCRPGEVGEVWVQGDNVFSGYWRMPEKTKESFAGPWFKTGDLGYQEAQDQGRLYLVGRKKELIITGGYNVYPKEVENILEQHESIQEAAVIGLPDEEFGERVTAMVVLKKEADPLPPHAIIAHCKRQLAGYKCPKKVLVVDQLPRNAMGKVQKQICQKMISLQLGDGGSKPPLAAKGEIHF